MERWRKIVEEAEPGTAAGPRHRRRVAPMGLGEALREWSERGLPGRYPVRGAAGSREHSLRAAVRGAKPGGRRAVLIGPGGGFSPAEVAEAMAAGLRPVSLGPRVLRAETAAMLVCAAALYETADEPSPSDLDPQ